MSGEQKEGGRIHLFNPLLRLLNSLHVNKYSETRQDVRIQNISARSQ